MRSRKIVHLPNAVKTQINAANVVELICIWFFILKRCFEYNL